MFSVLKILTSFIEIVCFRHRYYFRFDPTPATGRWYDVCTAVEKCCKITKFAVRIPDGCDVDPKYKVVDIEGLVGWRLSIFNVLMHEKYFVRREKLLYK